MSALSWIAASQNQPEPWDQMATPSTLTTYYIYDNGDGTFLVTVVEQKGKHTLNNQIAAEAADVTAAESACQADWDSGIRK